MIQNMENDQSAELRYACEAALDELTASLTQVLKAVNRVHRTMKKLHEHAERGAAANCVATAEK